MTAAAAHAQIVRGTVVDEGTGMSVGQAVVRVEGRDGTVRLGAFSDDSGHFAIRVPASGRYVLRVERIGFRPSEEVELTLGEGETVHRRIALRAVPVALSAVVTLGTGRCVRRDDAGAVADVWSAARASLQAAALTQDQRMVGVTLEQFERLHRSNGQVIREQRSTRTGISDNPFASAPAESLSAHGYRRAEAADTLTYYAPDARVLLSDLFARDHCFRLRAADAAHAGQVGLAFEPVRLGELLDVKGVLWLDQHTSELRTLEFQYASRRADTPDRRFGGQLDFERLQNGAVIVRKWLLRVPVHATTGMPDPRASSPSPWRPIVGMGEFGGEVMDLVMLRENTRYRIVDP